MDLIIPSMTLGSAANAVPAQSAQRPRAGTSQSAEQAPPAGERGFAEALSDPFGSGKDGTGESTALSRMGPGHRLTPAPLALLSQGLPAPQDARSQADLGASTPAAEGLLPILGMGGSEIPVEGSVIQGDLMQSALLAADKGLAGVDSCPRQATEQAGPGHGETVSDGQGKPSLLGALDQNVGAMCSRPEAEASIPKGMWKQRQSVPSEAPAASADGQERNSPRTAMPQETVRAAGCDPPADPGILFSRSDALKGAEPPGRGHVADLPSTGSPGPAEADASWAGKEGATWKQDISADAHSRTPPSPASSVREVPLPMAQAASNGTFHVFRNTVHMQIHDEVLGQIRWHVHLKGEKITAEAVVETTRVQELLRSHQDLLEYKLNNAGVHVEDFQVSVDQGSHRFPPPADQERLNPSGRSVEDEPCTPGVNLSAVQTPVSRDRGLDLYA